MDAYSNNERLHSQPDDRKVSSHGQSFDKNVDSLRQRADKNFSGGFVVPDPDVHVVDIGTTPEISQDPTQTSTVDESAWIRAKVEQIDSDQHGDYLEPNSEKIYREKVR